MQSYITKNSASFCMNVPQLQRMQSNSAQRAKQPSVPRNLARHGVLRRFNHHTNNQTGRRNASRSFFLSFYVAYYILFLPQLNRRNLLVIQSGIPCFLNLCIVTFPNLCGAFRGKVTSITTFSLPARIVTHPVRPEGAIGNGAESDFCSLTAHTVKALGTDSFHGGQDSIIFHFPQTPAFSSVPLPYPSLLRSLPAS